MKGHRKLLGWIVLLGSLLLWETLSRHGVLSPNQVPSPTQIVVAGYDEIMSGDLPEQMLLTARHLIVGFVIAAFVAVPVGFSLGRMPLLHAAFEPVIEFLRPMPVIAVLPIAVL